MTVKQLAEIFKAKDRARMLLGEEQPRQEAFVNGYGDVDWDAMTSPGPSTRLATPPKRNRSKS